MGEDIFMKRSISLWFATISLMLFSEYCFSFFHCSPENALISFIIELLSANSLNYVNSLLIAAAIANISLLITKSIGSMCKLNAVIFFSLNCEN